VTIYRVTMSFDGPGSHGWATRWVDAPSLQDAKDLAYCHVIECWPQWYRDLAGKVNFIITGKAYESWEDMKGKLHGRKRPKETEDPDIMMPREHPKVEQAMAWLEDTNG